MKSTTKYERILGYSAPAFEKTFPNAANAGVLVRSHVPEVSCFHQVARLRVRLRVLIELQLIKNGAPGHKPPSLHLVLGQNSIRLSLNIYSPS